MFVYHASFLRFATLLCISIGNELCNVSALRCYACNSVVSCLTMEDNLGKNGTNFEGFRDVQGPDGQINYMDIHEIYGEYQCEENKDPDKVVGCFTTTVMGDARYRGCQTTDKEFFDSSDLEADCSPKQVKRDYFVQEVCHCFTDHCNGKPASCCYYQRL